MLIELVIQGTNPTEGRQNSAKTLILMFRPMQRENYIHFIETILYSSPLYSQPLADYFFGVCVTTKVIFIMIIVWFGDTSRQEVHYLTGPKICHTKQINSILLIYRDLLSPVEMVNNPSSAYALEGENTDRTQKERKKNTERWRRRRKTKERVIQLMHRTMCQLNRHHLIMPFN